MKKTAQLCFTLIVLLLHAAAVPAATLYWSADGVNAGGTNTWNTNSARWGPNVTGPFNVVWTNANSDSPFLAGATTGGSTVPGGTVTIGTPITINGTLTWEQTAGTLPSYALSGSSVMTFSPGSVLS